MHETRNPDMQAVFQEVADVLELYFDGLYEGDTQKLRRVFAPGAKLFSGTGGEFVEIGLDDYMDIVAGRPAPASRGHLRFDRIESMDIAGDSAVVVKVECAVPPKYFTDLLTMVKRDGRWRIVNKAYHFVEGEDRA